MIAAAPATEGPACDRFFHGCMAVLTAALAAVELICLLRFHYALELPQFETWFRYLSICAALGYCYWAGYERLQRSCWIVLWSCLLGTLLEFPMYLAARVAAPLQDRNLARIDKALGLEVPSVLQLLAHHPWASRILEFSYDLLLPLIVVGLVLPAVRYRWTAAKELIVGTSFATVAGSVLFAFLPAVGPWAIYGFAPSPTQQSCQALLMNLRSRQLHVLNPNDTGIICFPSFHVLLALLSCVALFSIKPLRIPAAVVTASIVISTMTTGWHYTVDVVGGAALALASIWVAKLYTRAEALAQKRPGVSR